MKKKLLLTFLAVIAIIACAFGFAGCSFGNNNGDQNDDSGNNTEQTENKPSDGEQTETESLKFTLNNDRKSYSVTGIGTVTSCLIKIPSTYNGLPVTKIGGKAFYKCTSLTSITIPNSVTSIGDNPFDGCTSLESITVESGNTKYHSAGNCLIETESKTLIFVCKNSVIPTDGSVTSIGNYAFSGCTALTSVTIPNSVTYIGNGTFWVCTSLTNITIPDSVTKLGYEAFCDCSSLKSITIPNSVTYIDAEAFWRCTSLKSITIPNSVTYIGADAFRYCSSLTIYCEAESKPSEWNNWWNASVRPVVWGYKG